MRMLSLSLVAVLVVASLSVAQQEASAQVETRKIGVIVETAGDRYFNILNATFAVALDDFNRWLVAENKGWLLETETVHIRGASGTVAAIEHFDNQNITAVVGYVGDAGLWVANDAIHEKNLVVISSKSGMPKLANPDDNIFRTALNYKHYINAIVEIMKFNDVDEVLLISLESIYLKSMANMLDARIAEEADMRVLGAVYSKFVDPNATVKIRNSVESLLAESENGAKVAILLHIDPRPVPDVIRALKDLDAINDPRGQVLLHGWQASIPVIMQNPDVLDFLNRAEYHVFTPGVHSNDVNIGIDSALAEKKLPVLGVVTYDSYDALHILGRAIDKAGGVTDAGKIREHMHSAAEEHVSARGLPEGSLLGFDENGDRASQDYHTLELIRGEFILSKEYDPDANQFMPIVDFLAKSPSLSPAQQVAAGVEPENVTCKDGLALMLRSDGSPICVTPASAERLAAMGIATIVEK